MFTFSQDPTHLTSLPGVVRVGIRAALDAWILRVFCGEKVLYHKGRRHYESFCKGKETSSLPPICFSLLMLFAIKARSSF